jgi:DNA-binding beta-propeller fold protein YncE
MLPPYKRARYGAARHSCKTILRAGLVLGLAFAFTHTQPSHAAEPAEAPHMGEGGLPQFEFDATWGTLRPEWKYGTIANGIAVNDAGHVFLIHKQSILKAGGTIDRSMIPGTDWYKADPKPMPKPLDLKPGELPPPVIEFDPAGKVVRAWGEEKGKGWTFPGTPHTIAIGPENSIYVIGYRDIFFRKVDGKDQGNFDLDTQLLRFTKEGKFISAFGKAENGVGSNKKTDSFNGPTGVAYYKKTNEVFISDGYENNRIIVLDAVTGQFKRMWGAYGLTPLDREDRQPISEKLVRQPWNAVKNRLTQFKDIHDIAVSDDGYVYAADRGNHRLQVFTIDGKFVAEQFLAMGVPIEFMPLFVAVSHDQRFLYAGHYILNRKTLEVLGKLNLAAQAGEPGQSAAGHHIAVDKVGNIFVAFGDRNLRNRSGIRKYVFKGYSPETKCCAPDWRSKAGLEY